jgi:cardiolipin synthase
MLTTLAANVFVDSLLESGVRIFRYRPGLMHGKFFLFDEQGAAVSTVNLDNRSLRLNFEVTALALDAEFNRQVAAMFEDDFVNSVEMEPDHFARKPFWYRVAARAAYLLAPVL